MQTEREEDPVEAVHPLLVPLLQARDLYLRFRDGERFRRYVLDRLPLVIPAVVVVFLIGSGCALATILLISGLSTWLLLFGFILAPFVCVGSIAVQLFVLFSWLENRAIPSAHGEGAQPAQGPIAAWASSKLGVNLGEPPPLPWVFAAIFVLAPLAVLLIASTTTAIILIGLGILTPLLYALLDR